MRGTELNQNKYAIKSIITLLKGMVDYVIGYAFRIYLKGGKHVGK